MVEAETAKPIGLEEYNAFSEQDTNRRLEEYNAFSEQDTNRREVSNGKDFETNHIAHVCTGLWAFGRRSSWDRQHAAVSQQQQQGRALRRFLDVDCNFRLAGFMVSFCNMAVTRQHE